MLILNIFTILKFHEVFSPDLLVVDARFSLNVFFSRLGFNLALVAICFNCFDIIRVSKLRRKVLLLLAFDIRNLLVLKVRSSAINAEVIIKGVGRFLAITISAT